MTRNVIILGPNVIKNLVPNFRSASKSVIEYSKRIIKLFKAFQEQQPGLLYKKAILKTFPIFTGKNCIGFFF